MEPIDAEGLMQLSTTGPFSSGGLDGWAPHDWAVLPLIAFQWLAQLLNAIEAGHPWPSGVQHGRAVFLQKDPKNPRNKKT